MSAILDIDTSADFPIAPPEVKRVILPQYSPKVQPNSADIPSLQLLQIVHTVEPVSLAISIPDFNSVIDGTIVQLERSEEVGSIGIKVSIDASVEANIAFAGRLNEDRESFEIEEVLFRLAPTEDCARADFVATTINAALSLSEKVYFHLPETIALAGFDLPLIEVSRLLQSRQTSFRLMTIERATGIRFALPPLGFSGTDIAGIIFVFRAIVDRAFTYHLINGIPIEIKADEEGAKSLRSLEESRVMAFGPEEMSKPLLGVEISLGRMTVKIPDPYIVGIERVREEIAMGDGHLVTVLVRSVTNQALFELPEAPRLPPDAWDRRTQMLIDLEETLDSHLIERYHALAASTLAGLSTEERTRVTKRVELDDDTFLY